MNQTSLFGNPADLDQARSPWRTPAAMLPGVRTRHVTLKFEVPSDLFDDPAAAADYAEKVAALEARRYVYEMKDKLE